MFTDLVAVDSVYKFRELKLLVNFVTAYFVDKKYATLKTITIVKMKLFFQNKFHWFFTQLFAFWSSSKNFTKNFGY